MREIGERFNTLEGEREAAADEDHEEPDEKLEIRRGLVIGSQPLFSRVGKRGVRMTICIECAVAYHEFREIPPPFDCDVTSRQETMRRRRGLTGRDTDWTMWPRIMFPVTTAGV